MPDLSPIINLPIGDLTVACRRVGPSSPHPILFLHGLGDSSIITFERPATAPELADSPSLLLDLPGFGYSAAPESWPATMEDHAGTVIASLESLDISRVSIVGHSMGGSLALLIAHTRPDMVSRLVLAEPLLKKEHSELGITIARRREKDFVDRGFDMLRLATRRQAARGNLAAAGFRAPLDRASPAILHRSAVSLLADRSPAFLDMLDQLNCFRALLIGARTDIDTGFVPPDVKQIRIPDAGHSMMNENPEAFVRAVAYALGRDKKATRTGRWGR